VTSSEQTDTMDESAARLEVSVGNESFEPGRTQVVLDSNGAVHVLSELEGSDPHRAEAKLDPERATEMIRAAGRSVTGAREGKRYGLPDEPRYHFEIGGGEARRSIDVWRSELPEHPELNRVVTTLQQVVDEYGKGEIIL
jgi:hypothetical protein